jgi:hypothetical protein
VKSAEQRKNVSAEVLYLTCRDRELDATGSRGNGVFRRGSAVTGPKPGFQGGRRTVAMRTGRVKLQLARVLPWTWGSFVVARASLAAEPESKEPGRLA